MVKLGMNVRFRYLVMICLCTFIFGAVSRSRAQSVAELADGQKVKITGKIALERRGNRTFPMLRVEKPYLAIFDKDDKAQVTEVEILLDGQGAEIKKYLNQTVTVEGKAQLEPVSPYYFNGVAIHADSVTLSNGTVLQPVVYREQTPLPPQITRFRTLATYSPAKGSFSYQASDSEGHSLPQGENYLSCGLNGPGDVMNCFCPKGFEVASFGTQKDGKLVLTEKPRPDLPFAQFGIPEDLKGPISKAVECARTNKK